MRAVEIAFCQYFVRGDSFLRLPGRLPVQVVVWGYGIWSYISASLRHLGLPNVRTPESRVVYR